MRVNFAYLGIWHGRPNAESWDVLRYPLYKYARVLPLPRMKASDLFPELRNTVFHYEYTMVILSKGITSIMHVLEKWGTRPEHFTGIVSQTTSVCSTQT